jgi:hypothetical protein
LIDNMASAFARHFLALPICRPPRDRECGARWGPFWERVSCRPLRRYGFGREDRLRYLTSGLTQV